MSDQLRFYKICENAKLPVREHLSDAGMDLFYCPEADSSLDCRWGMDKNELWIAAGETCLVPTGLKAMIPKNHMLEIKNKSGIAFKQRLLVGACVVDSGYTGQIFVNLHNIGNQTQVLKPGQKIAQAVLVPIVTKPVIETLIDPSDLSTKRGSGGFGSTGV